MWEFVSRFSDWKPYQHRVKGWINRQLHPIPFNLDTLFGLLPLNSAEHYKDLLLHRFGYGTKVPIHVLLKSKESGIKWLAEFIYDRVYRNYTAKMWGKNPESVAEAITTRVPIHISKDDRYFQDTYQGLPKQGYTEMLAEILSHRSIHVVTGTDFREIVNIREDVTTLFGNIFSGEIIYTGPIDELFDFCYGELPYRSLRLEFMTYPIDQFQEAATINYPNDYTYTRRSEFKQITGQVLSGSTTILTEYPQPFDRHSPNEDLRFYPDITVKSRKLYDRYRRDIDKLGNFRVFGRLAEFKYYNMDDIIRTALEWARQ